MSRHKNIGNLASDAYQYDEGQDLYENYDDGYGDEYGEYGEYGGEYDAPVKISKKKKQNGTNAGPGGYEEDLPGAEEDPEMAAAIKASMASQPKAIKKVKSAIDPQMVNMLIEMFGTFFSKAQIEGTLSANSQDFDKSVQSLTFKKEQLDKKGKGNIKAKVSKQVEELKAQEAIKQAKIDEEKKFNKQMNGRVEKDDGIFQKVSKEVMNKLYDDVDYGIAYDVEAAKKKINMAIIGHVDSGKSTLMGHLLTQLGLIDQRQIRKNEKECEQIGKGSFQFAWVMDQDAEERKRGITINTAKDSFSTKNKNFSIIDCPGHVDFIGNMITGASQAECAILVIDAHKGGFEKGWEGGSTKDHAIIARALGVTQLVCAVNKLDTEDWSEARYDEILQIVTPFLTSPAVGYKEDRIQFIPLSALCGENLETRDSQPQKLSQWYNDKQTDKNKMGFTLVEAIDEFKSRKNPVNKPIRVCVYDFYNKGQDAFSAVQGDCISCKIESGVIQEKDKLILKPLDEMVTIKAIEKNKEKFPNAFSGEMCEIQIQTSDKFDCQYIKSGMVLCDPKYPIYQVYKFQAKIIIYDVQFPVLKGKQFNVYTFSNKISGVIKSLDKLLSMKDDKELNDGKRPKRLVKDNYALVTIKLDERICLEKFANNKSMGRIALRDGDQTIGSGVVTELLS